MSEGKEYSGYALAILFKTLYTNKDMVMTVCTKNNSHELKSIGNNYFFVIFKS